MHFFLRLAAFAALSVSLYAPPMPAELSLMPWPKEVSVQPGELAITGAFTVSVTGPGAADPRVQKALPRLIARLVRQTGIPLPVTAPVSAQSAATLAVTVAEPAHEGMQRLGDNESYWLTVADNHAKLTGANALGILRGMETFLQLVRPNSAPSAPGFSIPNVTIADEPRFAWRGLSFDVARHFMPVATVKRTLDGLAAVKLNVLHWHLSDDEGFRVESKTFPQLQALGSDGMFYTQEEIRDVIAYAADRGIRVVPEFDMPGHSTSWLAAYPELASDPGPYHILHDHEHGISAAMDPTKESTYDFLDQFIAEMAALFPDEYFHVGGDEVEAKKWTNNAHIRAYMQEHKMAKADVLQAYFSKRILAIVTKHGKRMVGWDEILNPDLPKTAVVQSWRGQQSLWSAAKDGYQGILSAGYYLDLSYPASNHYAIDPMKLPKSSTEASLTPAQAKLILGGEAAMWEEMVTPEMIDNRLWPRLAVVAERFWSPESTTEVASMYRRLKVTNEWLEWLGLEQRSSAELMRQRLAGAYPSEPLDRLAALVEPTKGYSRHAQTYGIFSSFNRLSFTIPSESDVAREFNNRVDEYLKITDDKRSGGDLRSQMADWSSAMQQVRPMLENQAFLQENIPVAEGVAKLCQTGQEAIGYLDSGATPPAGWKKKALTMVDPYVNKRFGDLLIQIAPGVQKLVQAVPGN